MAAPEAQFGKYKLLAKIAAGGMAIAYRAELTGAAGVRKRVVLKVIHPHLAQEKNFINMFISEARVAASLTHGNIAQVFDFGQIDGRYYISMEEVIGQPLSRVLKVARERGFGRLQVPLALQIGVGVLDGLHYAHTRKDETGKSLNLVHRDVTPDNVLLSYEGEVKVVDFGIAKTTFSVDQTEAGMVRGKYPYLSPEQASGSRELDPRADIWAVGVQLYDLLCGRRPYEGEFLHVMKDIVSPTPVPSLRMLARHLEPELDAIILTALNKPREERWSTAREFSQALTNYLHQRYPGSTRQDVQFLLATLFRAEASKEGADVTVPPSFTQDLQDASSGAAAVGKPAPPVATEPPSPVPPPPSIPKITASPSSRALPPVPDGGDTEATGIGLDIEEATRGLLPTTDEEPTLAAIPIKPRVTGERSPLTAPPKKKGESDKKLKSIAPEATNAAVVKVPEKPHLEHPTDDHEFPTLAAFPEPKKKEKERESKPPAKVARGDDTVETPLKTENPAATLSAEISVQNPMPRDQKKSRSKMPLVISLASVVFAGTAVGGYLLMKGSGGETEQPRVAPAQVWVTSQPPGATITLDGVAGGKTPAALNVQVGEHTVALELAGYAQWTRTFAARSSENVNLSADLELVGTVAVSDAGVVEEPAADAGAAVAAVVVADSPDAAVDEVVPLKPPPPPIGESNFARWPKRFHTLRLARMSLPLDAYAPLRIELNAKSSYQLSTQGQVNLGGGKTTNALFYFAEMEGPGAGKVGVLSPTPKKITGARAIRVFALDDDLEDNTGTMRIVARVSQYVPEKMYTFDAAKHALTVKPEHRYHIAGMNEASEYLVFSRVDMPALNKNPQGKPTEVLCVSETEKPRPLSKAAHLVPFGQKVTLNETGALSCYFFDDLIEDNGGSVELDIVDAARAAAEGVVQKQYAPVGKW